jgi:adenylate cyclase
MFPALPVDDVMSTEGVQRKLAAVLHADVKGFSRLMGDDEVATVRTLTAYKGLMGKFVELHRGRIVDIAGDGFLLEFPSVVDAMACAVEFQREIKARNADLPQDRKMEFRIGINVGDVIQDGERIYGDGVNIAARLEGLAEGGGICISGTAYDQLKRKLALEYEYLGEQAVKNISDPVRAYCVRLEPRAAPPDDARTEEIGARPPHTKRIEPRQWHRGILAALVLCIVAAVAVAVWHSYFRAAPAREALTPGKTAALELPDKPSVSVLPFENTSGDPQQEYFSDGMTDQIIAGLAKIPQLFVIAPASAFAFKGRSVEVGDVGRQLGVRYVLEGSARKEGDRVNLTARLTDAKTGSSLWEERYDRPLKDLFALQSEIARKVLSALNLKLTDGEQARLTGAKPPTGDLDAYEKFLQGNELYRRRDKSGNTMAQQMFQEAVSLDPRFGQAYGALAQTYLLDARRRWSGSPRESWEQAVRLAQKAVSLDDSSDTIYVIVGRTYLRRRQYKRAVRAVERAVALNPNGADARAWLGCILDFTGRPEEAISLLQEAIRLNPISPGRYGTMLGNACTSAKRYEEAIAAYKSALRSRPNDARAYLGLAAAYSLSGRKQEARAAASEALKLSPRFSLNSFSKTLLYRDPGTAARVVDALREAGLN